MLLFLRRRANISLQKTPLAVFFCGLLTFATPVWGVTVLELPGTVPTFRATSAATDAVIRDSSDWNYLGIFNYQTAAAPFLISGQTCYQTTDQSYIVGGTTFAWSEGLGMQTGNVANPSPQAGNAVQTIFTGSIDSGGARTLTMSGLTPGEYYTFQIFASGTSWGGGTRKADFSFNSTATPATDQYYFYPNAGQSTLVSSTRLHQENLTGAGGTESGIDYFTGSTAPLSLEYSFQAQASTFALNLASLDIHSWHVYGVALAQRDSNPLARTLYADMVNDGGKLAVSAYAMLDGVPQTNVAWKVEMASTLDGERLTLVSGDTPIGQNAPAYVHGNILQSLNLDPSFEAAGAGKETKWEIVLSGDGHSAYLSNFGGMVPSPTAGNYFAYAGQTSWDPGNNMSEGRDGVQGKPGLIRSGEFELTGDAISFVLMGGAANPGRAYPFTDISGYLGVGLWDVDAQEYVLFKTRTGANNDWQTVTFTEAEIAAIMYGTDGTDGTKNVTIDLIDDFAGGWGFQAADNFEMLGDLRIDPNLYYFLTVDGFEMVTLGGPMGQAVPEPAAWAMLLLGLAALTVCRRRWRK